MDSSFADRFEFVGTAPAHGPNAPPKWASKSSGDKSAHPAQRRHARRSARAGTQDGGIGIEDHAAARRVRVQRDGRLEPAERTAPRHGWGAGASERRHVSLERRGHNAFFATRRKTWWRWSSASLCPSTSMGCSQSFARWCIRRWSRSLQRARLTCTSALLRRRLAGVGAARALVTVHRVGYMLRASAFVSTSEGGSR